MIQNRSVPTNSILPHIVYQNVADALAWLTTTFGFIEHYRYGPPHGPVQGAQMYLGNAWIMVEAVRAGRATPVQLAQWTQMLTVFVDDVQDHYEQVKATGATLIEDLNETMYGERQYVVADLDGHHWLFSQHVKDAHPADWSARVTDISVQFT